MCAKQRGHFPLPPPEAAAVQALLAPALVRQLHCTCSTFGRQHLVGIAGTGLEGAASLSTPIRTWNKDGCGQSKHRTAAFGSHQLRLWVVGSRGELVMNWRAT